MKVETKLKQGDFSPRVQEWLSYPNWPSTEPLDKELIIKLAKKNGYYLFPEWWDFVELFHDINFRIADIEFEYCATHELVYPKGANSDVDAVVGKKCESILADENEFCWCLAQDGSVYSEFWGMVYFQGESLNVAFENLIDGVEATKIGTSS